MNFLELAKGRYSCRAYRSDPIDDAMLARVLEGMRLAPSACNRQPYQLHVLKTAQHVEALSSIYRQPWFVQAPIVVAMVAQMDRAWCHRDGMNLGLVDAAIAFDHLQLTAAAEGLGTCWIASFQREPARALLDLTDTAEILAFSPIGHPNDEAPNKQRLPLEQLVRYTVG